jgi:hypothetical protein
VVSSTFRPFYRREESRIYELQTLNAMVKTAICVPVGIETLVFRTITILLMFYENHDLTLGMVFTARGHLRD